jgi:hypothetical protein
MIVFSLEDSILFPMCSQRKPHETGYSTGLRMLRLFGEVVLATAEAPRRRDLKKNAFSLHLGASAVKIVIRHRFAGHEMAPGQL